MVESTTFFAAEVKKSLQRDSQEYGLISKLLTVPGVAGSGTF